jgi:AhpD family alkylhydroperoxidase
MSNHIPRIARSQFGEFAPDALAGFRAVQKATEDSGLDHTLLELIKIRASQINGCAFCVEMHINDSKKLGISDEKLYMISVWEETHGVFSEREQAALLWTEELTKIAGNDVSDDAYEKVKANFDEKEIAYLTSAVALINSWNRIAKPLRYALSGTLKD